MLSPTLRRRTWLAGAGALAAGTLGDGLGGQAARAQSKPVTIGLSAPITGDMTQYGVDIRQGAELAVAEINKARPLPGATVTLDVQDSRGDPKEAANVAQKFAAAGNVLAVVGDFSSTASLAAAPIYQRAGIIMITPTASHPDITKTGSYIFRDTPIAATEVKAVVDWAKEIGAKRVAVIGRNDDYGRAYGNLFKAGAEGFGAEVVGVEFVNPGEQDFKPLITGLRARRPDVVMLAMFQVEAALLFQQSRDMAFKPQFMSGAGLFNPQLLSLAGSAANGLLLVSTYFPDNPAPQVQSFVAAYKERFKSVPSKFAAHSFDAARLIAAAIKAAGATDPAKVRDALAATKDFPGVIGTVTIDPNREVVLDLQRLQVKDARFVPWVKPG